MSLNASGAEAGRMTATECGRYSLASATGGDMLDGPFRYAAAGCEFHVTTPDRDRDLWYRYLGGALANYRRFGVESVLEYAKVEPGDTTSLFFAAVDPRGEVVGGMRVQGRYGFAEEAHALTEWTGRPGTEELRTDIACRIDDGGVIEMKTGWVAPQFPRKRELTAALARIFLHAIRLADVRYALGTVATHAVPKWSTTGGEISSIVTPVAYPDARYRTVPMWWDRDKPLTPDLEAKMDDEHGRLLWSAMTERSQRVDSAA